MNICLSKPLAQTHQTETAEPISVSQLKQLHWNRPLIQRENVAILWNFLGILFQMCVLGWKSDVFLLLAKLDV